jgi:hypothetical protein
MFISSKFFFLNGGIYIYIHHNFILHNFSQHILNSYHYGVLMLMVSKPTCKGYGHSSHLSRWKDGDDVDGLMGPTG